MNVDENRTENEVVWYVSPAHGTSFVGDGHALDAQIAEDVAAVQANRVLQRLQANCAVKLTRHWNKVVHNL